MFLWLFIFSLFEYQFTHIHLLQKQSPIIFLSLSKMVLISDRQNIQRSKFVSCYSSSSCVFISYHFPTTEQLLSPSPQTFILNHKSFYGYYQVFGVCAFWTWFFVFFCYTPKKKEKCLRIFLDVVLVQLALHWGYTG